MKTLLLVLLGTLFFFNKTVAQNCNLSLLLSHGEALPSKKGGSGFELADTGKIYLFFGKEHKPLLSFQADFSKSPKWFDFTVKDTAGNVRLQSLLQIINDDLVQWQLIDSAQTDRFTSVKGNILFLRRMQ